MLRKEINPSQEPISFAEHFYPHIPSIHKAH